jgi:hypothetical protein
LRRIQGTYLSGVAICQKVATPKSKVIPGPLMLTQSGKRDVLAVKHAMQKNKLWNPYSKLSLSSVTNCPPKKGQFITFGARTYTKGKPGKYEEAEHSAVITDVTWDPASGTYKIQVTGAFANRTGGGVRIPGQSMHQIDDLQQWYDTINSSVDRTGTGTKFYIEGYGDLPVCP